MFKPIVELEVCDVLSCCPVALYSCRAKRQHLQKHHRSINIATKNTWCFESPFNVPHCHHGNCNLSCHTRAPGQHLTTPRLTVVNAVLPKVHRVAEEPFLYFSKVAVVFRKNIVFSHSCKSMLLFCILRWRPRTSAYAFVLFISMNIHSRASSTCAVFQCCSWHIVYMRKKNLTLQHPAKYSGTWISN